MGAVLEFYPLTFLIAAMGFAVVGGFVKGVVGFAFPLVMISSLAAIYPPEIALAGLIIPTALTNIWQAFRYGLRAAASSIRNHWPFMVVGLTLMAITAQFVLDVPQAVFFTVLGVPITLYALMRLFGVPLRVPAHRRGLATFLFGGIAGTMGGFAAVWGPPTVAYLTSLDTEKKEQVQVQGMVYFLGAVLLFGSHLRSGVLNADTAPFSLALVPAALGGMWFGQKVQDRLDKAQFMRMTLLVLFVAGLNLLRRAWIG